MSLLLRNTCPGCNSSTRSIFYKATIINRSATSAEYVGTNNGYGQFHDLQKCNSCDLIYMDPIDSELTELCAGVEDNDYLESQNERRIQFQKHLAELEKYISKGKLLDVGCYAGLFLREAIAHGFEAEGVEPSLWAVEQAKKLASCKVQQGMFDDIDLPTSHFDVVTMWDVIEHLATPAVSLKKAFSVLKPGGHIAITTHDIESIFARSLGKFYPWLMRFHLVHFSPRTLTKLLETCGFEIVDVTYYRKSLSLRYFLKRLKINLPPGRIGDFCVSINTGDMFMVVGKKPQ